MSTHVNLETVQGVSKTTLFKRLAPKVLNIIDNKAPRRSIRIKISPKHCKILSTCDLGTKFCDSRVYDYSWLGVVAMRHANTKPEEQW